MLKNVVEFVRNDGDEKVQHNYTHEVEREKVKSGATVTKNVVLEFFTIGSTRQEYLLLIEDLSE